MASSGGGPAISAAKLVGRSPPHWCPSPEEDGSLALPPEQRGKIHRALADDEGDVGRWMDVPHPGEVWGGAVGLTAAMLECVLLPFPFHGPHGGADGGADGEKGRDGGSAGGKAEEDEGTEMTEKGAAAPVRVITPDDDEEDTDTAAAAAAAAVSKRAHAARPPPAPSSSSTADDYTADCITAPPHPSCVPGAPLDTGAKVRVSKSTRPTPYFRELADDDDGALPSPGQCFSDMRAFTEQTATCMCVAWRACAVVCCARGACACLYAHTNARVHACVGGCWH
jgi:hypothetical protein